MDCLTTLPPAELQDMPNLKFNFKGELETTTGNFLEIMRHDPAYRGIRFNEVSETAEVHEIIDGKPNICIWDDTADAQSRSRIEALYNLYSIQKHDDALRILFNENVFNPIRDIIDGITWDGESRCELFLERWAKAERSDYVREVSRLIFAEGIARLYQPGSKADYVPILIGTRQGEGKSTLVRWLALNDCFYASVNDMSGSQRSIEALQGAWICEIEELSAFRKTEVEALKAFVSRTADRYRKPWDKRVSNLPRRCIFIGTTNSRAFLADRTGNRRFLPVEVKCSGKDIYAHEDEIRKYIMQAWAEAKARYDRGEMPCVPNPAVLEEAEARQASATFDDWRIGAIRKYAKRMIIGDRACVRDLYIRALYPDQGREPTLNEAREIGEILDRIPGLERLPNPVSCGTNGKQRAWKKIAETPD